MESSSHPQHDYRQLPRSSGDGMETKNLVNETVPQNKNVKQVEHQILLSQPKRNYKSGNTSTITQASLTDKKRTGNSETSAQFVASKNTEVHSSNMLQTDISQHAHLLEFQTAVESKCVLLERQAKCLDLNVRIKDLEENNQVLTFENGKLIKKLDAQIKINADLKKLLVASVGEDIGSRLQEMVADKTKFESTLTNLQMQLEKVSEELSRVSIECDVWRSKFLASRVMATGLTDVRTTLFVQNQNYQAALQKLLEEQSDIRQHLRATNRLLQGVHNATVEGTGRRNDCWEKTFQKISIIELAHVNNNLAEDICHSVNSTYFYETVNNNSCQEEEMIPVSYLTPAEQLACQVLKVNTQDSSSMDQAMQKISRQYMGNSYASRFLTNNFRITLDCCDRCTGLLQVV